MEERKRLDLLTKLRAKLQRIANKQRKLQRRISRDEESAYYIDQEIRELIQLLEGQEGQELLPTATDRPRPRTGTGKPPAQSASHLELWRLPDGSFTVRVDKGDVFYLSPKLGALLLALSEGSGESPSPGTLVPFKDFHAIAKAFSGTKGKTTQKNLRNVVLRLRDRLEEEELSRRLIQSRAGGEYRFALLLDGTRIVHDDLQRPLIHAAAGAGAGGLRAAISRRPDAAIDRDAAASRAAASFPGQAGQASQASQKQERVQW